MKITARPLSLTSVLAAESLAGFWSRLAEKYGAGTMVAHLAAEEIRRAYSLRRAYERRSAVLSAWNSAVSAWNAFQEIRSSAPLPKYEEAFRATLSAYRSLDSARRKACRVSDWKGTACRSRLPLLSSPSSVADGR